MFSNSLSSYLVFNLLFGFAKVFLTPAPGYRRKAQSGNLDSEVGLEGNGLYISPFQPPFQ